MIRTLLSHYFPVFPEVFVTLSTFVLMIYGLIRGESSYKMLQMGVKTVLFVAIILCFVVFKEPVSLFHGHYDISMATQLAKAAILFMVFILCFMGLPHFEREEIKQFEGPILIVFATLGMMSLVSASDFMTLFMGIEILSLSLYILVAIQHNKVQSSEAGLKYFILGALSTAILLYGISLLYGFSGTTDYEGIARALTDARLENAYAIWIAFVFILASFAFKVSVAPFHMWTPDVYEGSPTPITAFLASAPKFAVIFALLRLIENVIAPLLISTYDLLIGLSITSMLLGAIAGLFQTNIKRLLAYSTISHMGYSLLGFLKLSPEGSTSIFFYLFTYALTSLGVFACILNLRRHGRLVEELRDLSGLAKENRLVACCLAILLLSFAGIPPFVGFFAKFLVFKTAVDGGFYITAGIGVVASVIAATYYLKVVKIMFFDELLSEGGSGRLDRHMTWQTVWVMVGVTIFVLTYLIYPDFLLSMISTVFKA